MALGGTRREVARGAVPERAAARFLAVAAGVRAEDEGDCRRADGVRAAGFFFALAMDANPA
jgi:hypothetical protein